MLFFDGEKVLTIKDVLVEDQFFEYYGEPFFPDFYKADLDEFILATMWGGVNEQVSGSEQV